VKRAASAGYRALVVTVDAPVAGLRRREIHGDVHLPTDLKVPNLPDPTTGRGGETNFWAAVTEQFDPAVTPDDIAWLADVSGLPVAVKGVLRADDARRCVEAGAAAVVVSNHGARQLDDAPPTAEVLHPIADAVGERAELYVDGGIRRPADVLKALALGARGVLIGRPVLWALAVGGAPGVASLLGWFRSELARTMMLCGCPSLAQVDSSLVRGPS
jgi:4-hydroxymandelate oxidase